MTPNPKLEAALVGETYPAGTVLAGRYKILRALGEGGMGQVYACEHVAVGRKVALKVLQPWLAQHPVGERLRTEARAASAAGHPNIVDVFDAGILEDGRPFLAMEFLDGKTLLDLIERSRHMSIDEAATIGIAIARGLQAAHDAGIIHRDLKPENVMIIERDGVQVVKLVDFGIAFDTADEGKRLTREGFSVGTPQYMAPEQVFGAAGTPAFDVYALGVVLFEMCTGEPPFDGATTVGILEAKANSVAPRLEARRPDTPRWFGDLIAECLKHDPEDRPASAREIADRLERGLSQHTTGVVAPPAPQLPPEEDPTVVEAVPEGAGAERDPASVPEPTSKEEGAKGRPVHALPAPVASEHERRLGPLLFGGVATLVGVAMAGWFARPEPRVAMPGLVRIPVVMIPEAPKQIELEPEPATEMVPTLESPELESEPEPKLESATTLEVEPEAPPPSVAPDPKPERAERAGRSAEASNCKGVVDRARASSTKHLWGPVLEEVRKKRCWSNRGERQKLEVHALKELGRFSACAKAAKGSSDREVQSWMRLCEKRSER